MSGINDEALQQAWSGTVTPYSQIKAGGGIDEPGQYDFVVGALTPIIAENGMYAIEGEFPVKNPQGFQFPFRRTLYVGTKKDPMAALPETRLKSPALRFLRTIAEVNKVSTNDQSDEALCTAIKDRAFGCAIVPGKPYTAKDGTVKTGLEFGRNVTPEGRIPARVHSQPLVTTALPNGHATPTAAPIATFGTE